MVCTRLLTVVLVVALLGAIGAKADVPAFTVPTLTSPTNYGEGSPVVLGNVFTANATFFVDGLGIYFDSTLLPDLTTSETVGLYDQSGDLLAWTTVSPPGGPGSGYVFDPISQVELTVGTQYTVAAEVGNNPWAYGPSSGSPPTNSDITFNGNSYVYSPTLAFPTGTGGSGPAYYGPNFEIAPLEVTPEAGTVSLLMAMFTGLAGLVGLSKKRLL